MNVKEFKEFIAAISDEYNDCEVVCPVSPSGKISVMLEGVCPGISGITDLGAVPEEVKQVLKTNQPDNLKVLLIAPHAYHQGIEEDAAIERKCTLN